MAAAAQSNRRDWSATVWVIGPLTACVVSAAAIYTVTAEAGCFCADRVEGGSSSGATEALAQDAAIVWWSSRAGALGKGYENWASASDKKMSCDKQPDGSAKCTASARPCLPDGVLPDNVPRLNL